MGFLVTPASFVVSMANGYDVSVAFRPGNYASNRGNRTIKQCRGSGEYVTCPNAEVIVWLTGTNDQLSLRPAFEGRNDQWALMGDGMGLSWALAEVVAYLMAWVAALPEREDAAWKAPEGDN